MFIHTLFIRILYLSGFGCEYQRTYTHLALLAPTAAAAVARKWQTFIHFLPPLQKGEKKEEKYLCECSCVLCRREREMANLR